MARTIRYFRVSLAGVESVSPGLHYTGQAFKRRNVVRFKNKGAKEDLPDRRHVIRELLCNQMGFTPADILAVINLPDRQGYDISFKLLSSLDRFWAGVTKFRGAEGWVQFILIPVSKPGTVSVNILFWNESVPPQDIVIWLRRHCDMVSDLTKCLDDDGIWTGGWRVLVKLRQHSNVTLHLPNSFFIGRERGVCFYAGQPRLCFKCGKAGHVAGVCTVVKCNLCGEIGHTSAMCTNVRCNLCGRRRILKILHFGRILVMADPPSRGELAQMVYAFLYEVYAFLYEAYAFLYEAYAFLYEAYAFLYEAYAFLYEVYAFLYEVYAFLYEVYAFLYEVYAFLYEAYAFLYEAYAFLYEAYAFLYEAYAFLYEEVYAL
ncbi:zinc finger CCHC domain-containing protein 3-like [Gastrophryne carolinensis]